MNLLSASGHGNTTANESATVGAGIDSSEGTSEANAQIAGDGGQWGGDGNANSQSDGSGSAHLSGLPTLDKTVVDLGVGAGVGAGLGMYLWGGPSAGSVAASNNAGGEGASDNGEDRSESETSSGSGNSAGKTAAFIDASSEVPLTDLSICAGSDCTQILSDPTATLAFAAACVDTVGCTVTEADPNGNGGVLPAVSPTLLDGLTVPAASDVPEPETYALFAAGLALIAVRRLRAS